MISAPQMVGIRLSWELVNGVGPGGRFLLDWNLVSWSVIGWYFGWLVCGWLIILLAEYMVAHWLIIWLAGVRQADHMVG